MNSGCHLFGSQLNKQMFYNKNKYNPQLPWIAEIRFDLGCNIRCTLARRLEAPGGSGLIRRQNTELSVAHNTGQTDLQTADGT
jgi:hypothetical protein